MGMNKIRNTVKGSITSKTTQEKLEFLYNPESIKHTIEAVYARATIPGLSHQRSMYLTTKNVPYEFMITWDAFELNDPEGAEDAKLFLTSLCFPRAGRTIEGSSPGQSLLVFPGAYTVSGVIDKIEFEDVLFYADGPVRRWNAAIVFTEELNSRTTSSDIRKRKRVARNRTRIDFTGSRPFVVSNRGR